MQETLRLLVVGVPAEDMPLIRAELEDAGYVVEAERVDTGAALSDALERGAWDAVVAAYDAPGLTALEALKVCRTRGPDVPFIVLSDWLDRNTAVDVLRAGAHDYLLKGELGRLVPTLQRELAEAHERQARRLAQRDQALLSSAGQVLAGSLDYTLSLPALAQLIVDRLADWCSLELLEAEQLQLVALAHTGRAAQPLRADEVQQLSAGRVTAAAVAAALQTTHTQLILQPAASNLAQVFGSPAQLRLAQNLGIERLMVLPLLARGRAWGVMILGWRPAERDGLAINASLAEDLARRAGLVVDNTRLYNEHRRAQQAADWATQSVSRLYAITVALSEAVTPDQVAHVIITHGLPVLKAEAGMVALLDPASGEIGERVEVGQAPEFSAFGQREQEKATPLTDAIQSGKPVYLGARQVLDTRYPHLRQLLEGNAHQAWVAVPLLNDGQTVGVFGLAFSAPQAFLAPEREFVLTLAGQCAQAIAQAQLYQALEQRVHERTVQLRAANAELAYSEAQVRAFSRQLSSRVEAERTRIARQVHDVLGQQLTVLKMAVVRMCAGSPVVTDSQRDKLQPVLTAFDEAIQTVREIARELRPAVLDDMGLVSALEWEAEHFELRTQIGVDVLTSVAKPPVSPEQALAVFRVFQEALTNVARHAQATRVEVLLSLEAGQLELHVIDDGVGFDTAAAASPQSFGLASMRERASVVGGTLEITSQPGQGTAVLLKVPLDRPVG